MFLAVVGYVAPDYDETFRLSERVIMFALAFLMCSAEDIRRRLRECDPEYGASRWERVLRLLGVALAVMGAIILVGRYGTRPMSH